MIIINNPAAPVSYQSLLTTQGFTSYWSLQTQRNDTASEPDLIGSRTLTMSDGNTANNTSGPLGASDGSNAQTFVTSDTEGMIRSDAGFTLDADWSLSIWVKMTVQTGTANIIWGFDKGGDATRYLYLIRRDDRSGLCLQLGDGGSARYIDFSQEIENDGAWHHIVVTRDYNATSTLDTWKGYIDNVAKFTTTRSTVGHSSLPVAELMGIGNRYSVSVGMDGSIAHAAYADGVTIDAAAVAAQWAYRNF